MQTLEGTLHKVLILRYMDRCIDQRGVGCGISGLKLSELTHNTSPNTLNLCSLLFILTINMFYKLICISCLWGNLATKETIGYHGGP